ncbi:MAG TPA: hypothetical protein PLV73_11140, partial [Treponemataceae bacterium]|nr:hypothetical protein [Treponemataceae bacterium]
MTAAIRAVETFDPAKHTDLDARVFVCCRNRARTIYKSRTKQEQFEIETAQWSLDEPPPELKGIDAAPLVELLAD